MPLDRQSIQKKDFPTGRRGYDRRAVDAHLSAVAAEVDELRAEMRRRSETLASQTSEQVRVIVEAAEQSAAVMRRQSEADAREVREQAEADARRTRGQAAEQAREYVARMQESSSGVLERVEVMEGELGSLLEHLRSGANRVIADLAQLERSLAELSGPTAALRSPPAVEPEEPAAAGAVDATEVQVVGDEAETEVVAPEPEAETEPATAPGDDDAEGARLVALNMALNGTPREETDRYLAEHYALSDRAGLLDEVYATVGE